MQQIRLLAGVRARASMAASSLSLDANRLEQAGCRFSRPAFAGLIEMNDPRPCPPARPLVEQGLVPNQDPLSHNRQCRLLLEALGRRGVTVNYERRICAIGVKSILEERCRAHAAATGVEVPRPVTVVRNSHSTPALDVAWRIAKPVNGARAEGIAILPGGAETPAGIFPCVEQERSA